MELIYHFHRPAVDDIDSFVAEADEEPALVVILYQACQLLGEKCMLAYVLTDAVFNCKYAYSVVIV